MHHMRSFQDSRQKKLYVSYWYSQKTYFSEPDTKNLDNLQSEGGITNAVKVHVQFIQALGVVSYLQDSGL